ncbi:MULTISPECIES: putative quinol monooxygenase [unclassified Coleofasciculus]|uniref:putative quinol monooxygenase n=1 Tax=unclassified Coleofasciculus TaxID=2692782 RepID=UPI001881B20F|nr:MULTISPECIES: putative quinol monooxygenase [unclassified Coleofasciculus]MBE9128960.1 antibiotic biosynthesis monooxygenase [Coleofasciculus sp. LEGE 07081]MBE9151702.1 antibiotic biosynthesis monooxygenase [Coleofasciculus sp. LEGE 07092]
MTTSTIRILARLVALPGKEDVLKALLLELVEATRKETGCITYELLQSPAVPTEFAFVEEWENEEVWKLHMDSFHVEQAFREGEALFASPPDIRHYELLA